MQRDTTKIKSDILEFLSENGASLPVQISRYIKVDTLFTSAFLSELLGQEKIKMSHMRIGSSSAYFLPGTQSGLEKYSEYLKSKEKEAYHLLREHSFLDDANEHPAIRVALREIKDFAIPFKFGDKLIWRYFLVSASDYKKPEEIKIEKPIINNTANSEKEIKSEEPTIGIKKPIENNKIINNTEKPKELERILPKKEKESPKFINPLANNSEIKKPKEKPKSEFVIKAIEFIINSGWSIVEEISHKAKEYICLIQIKSDLGPIIFLTNAKDKKTVTESDMTKILGSAQSIPLPALILTSGEIQKKAQTFLEKFSSVLKVKKIN